MVPTGRTVRTWSTVYIIKSIRESMPNSVLSSASRNPKQPALAYVEFHRWSTKAQTLLKQFRQEDSLFLLELEKAAASAC